MYDDCSMIVVWFSLRSVHKEIKTKIKSTKLVRQRVSHELNLLLKIERKKYANKRTNNYGLSHSMKS